MEERKNINKVVGILHSTDKKAYEARGESYYLAYIERGGVTIPIITSKYFASTFNGKKVECTGVICTASSEVYETCQILSYFYCVVINECPEDTRDTGYVRIEGFVKKLWNIELTPSNTVVRKLKLECSVELDKQTTRSAPCRCFSTVARKSLELQEGNYIKAEGYLSGNKRSIRVVLKKYKKIS